MRLLFLALLAGHLAKENKEDVSLGTRTDDDDDDKEEKKKK